MLVRVWPGLVAAAVMLLVGLYRIGTPELWRDEVSSWSAGGRSLGELFGMLGNVDASNGAYYVVLHGWMAVFGDSPVALRLLSAVAMAGAALFSALTAQHVFRSRVAGLAAGLLPATVPIVSRYAQEARAYALVTCAIAAGVWCLVRVLERPSKGRWAAFAVCTAVAGLLHLVSLVGVVGQLPMVLVASRRRPQVLWQYPLALALAALPTLPLVVLGRSQSDRQLSWLVRPDLHDLRFFWEELFGSHRVLYAFLALALLAIVLPGRRAAAVQLLLLAGLPVVAVWVVSQGGTSYFLERYLLFTLPTWAVLAGGGVGAVAGLLRGATGRSGATGRRRRGVVWVAVGLVAVPAVLGLSKQEQVRAEAAHSATDFRGAAGLIAAGYRPGDGLVALAGDVAWAMVGPGVSYYLPGGVAPGPMFVARSAVEADDLYPVLSRAPADTIGDEARVWVVTIGTSDDPYQYLPAEQARALRSVFTPAEVRHVRGLTVTLLVRDRQHPT
ncbi:hypothetical protein GCM10010441_31720 [Kitasatospora paracochleata]|uniref:Mannosyltransferase n=1 Tax=Kitasatospora paracochleata TaxID=58354 RepID=A0ABT1IQD9_9ACTN|nr:glycosyltransferase family 39 protein [Kitasatospora paracochleata]MCP2307214.1 mannosyltransferase [Kitasatospora paracochleata]